MKVESACPSATPPGAARLGPACGRRTLQHPRLLDRFVYDNPEPLVALAAVAGGHPHVRVQTEVLLARCASPPCWPSRPPPWTAEPGRFVLAWASAAGEDDHEVAGVDLRTAWAGVRRADGVHAADLVRRTVGRQPRARSARRRIAPAARVLFGAFQPAALARVARFGDGFPPPPRRRGSRLIETVRGFWAEPDAPACPGSSRQANVALGPESVVDDARGAYGGYYLVLGARADRWSPGMHTTARADPTIGQTRSSPSTMVILICSAVVSSRRHPVGPRTDDR